MRLIDADELLAQMIGMNDGWFDPRPAYDHESLIKIQPTVDAVPVIRCKDCINWDTEWTTHPPDHYCPAIDQFTSADFYCGYAEKKEVEEQQCTSTDTEH